MHPLLALTAVVFFAACPSCDLICRNDQDCTTTDDKLRCIDSLCADEPVPESKGPPCTGDDASPCPGGAEGAACIEGQCFLRPRCQLLTLDRYPGLVRSEGVESTITATTAPPTDCAFDVELDLSQGVPGVVPVSFLPVAAVADIATSNAACARAVWVAERSAGVFRQCATDLGTFDIVLAPPGASACFVDSTGPNRCGTDACAALVEGEAGGLCP